MNNNSNNSYKEIFNDDGHLTDEGLKALMDDTLDELNRLEAAEHLSFCDECVMRYTDMLTDDAPLTPALPQAEGTDGGKEISLIPKKRIREKAVQIILHRYLPAAAAACFAIVLWGTGVFTSISKPFNIPVQQDEMKISAAIAQTTNGVMDELNKALSSITSAMRFTNNFKADSGASSANSANSNK